MTTLDRSDAGAGKVPVYDDAGDLFAEYPSGMADASKFAAVAAEVVQACDATTGWTAVGNQSGAGIATDASVKTEGTASITATLRLDVATAHMYHDFSVALDTAGQSFLAVDIRYASGGGPGLSTQYDYFAVEIADTAGLTGAVEQVPFPPFAIDSWTTVLIPVRDLTEIASVGIRRIVQSSTSLARVKLYIDNVRWPARSEIDVALSDSEATTVVVPADFTPASGEPLRDAPADATLLDLRPGHAILGRAGGFRHVREFGLAEDGATDVSDSIAAIIASLDDGDTLDFPPNKKFRVDKRIIITGKKDLTIRFNRARLCMSATRAADATHMNTSVIEVRNSDNITLDSPRIFGYRETVRLGNTLVASASNLLTEYMRNIESEDVTGSGQATGAGWSAVSNCTVGGSGRTGGGVVIEDDVSLSVTASAAGDATFGSATGTSGVRVLPSTSYTFTVKARHANTADGGVARTIRIDALWYDSGGSLLSTSTGSGTAEPATNTAVTVTQAHTSHASAAYVAMRVVIVSAGAASEVHYFDGFKIALTTATTLSTASTAATLTTLHQEVRIPDSGGEVPFYGRDPDGYCNFTFTLSDSAQVANDCELRILDDVTGKILATSTLTLTGTPTEYTISRFMRPDDLGRRLRVIARKLTPTTNTITVADSTEYQRNTYSGTIEQNVGIYGGQGCRNLTVINSEVEGVGGDAVSSSVSNSYGYTVKGGFSRCCMRQGISFNFVKRLRIYDYVIREAGRSALDFEPAGPDWTVDDVVIRNLKVYNTRNYVFAMNPWTRNINFDISDVVAFNDGISGIGFWAGGCRDSIVKGCKFYVTTSEVGQALRTANDPDWTVNGVNLTISDCETVGGWQLEDDAAVISDHDAGPARREYTSSGITLRDCKITSPFGRIIATANHKIEGCGFLSRWDDTLAFASGTYVGPLRLDSGSYYSLLDVAPYHRALPNSVKGHTAADLWFPGGLDMREDPLNRVRGIGDGTVKRNNLRGRVTPANSATSAAVSFPSRSVPAPAFTLLAGTGGSLTPSTTYYYRVAQRDRYGGPGTAATQASVTLNGSQTAVTVKITNTADTTNDWWQYGFTIWRGTTSGGPYTHRYDIVPTTDWPSLALGGGFVDTGTSATFAATADRSWGYPASTSATTGSFTPSDESGWEPDTNYDVFITPSWATTCHVTSRSASGFTINFGTSAPSGSETVSWFLVGF
jgi:hypothetical protein